MRRRLRRVVRFVAKLAQAQHRDQLMLRAAALAYTSLLSLVPLLTVALVLAARVQPERAELVVRAIAAVLPFSPARVQSTLTAFAERTARLGWGAVLLSVLVTFQAFYQIEETVNSVWGIPHRRRWQLRLASFTAVLVWGPLLLVAMFSALYWLYSRTWFVRVAGITRPLPAVFAVVALTALYRWVPHTRVPAAAAFGGACVATVALLAVNVGFQAYLGFASELNVVYGSLAIVLLFLISLLVFWFAVLLGAEASWVLGHAPKPPPEQAVQAVLSLLTEVSREGSVSWRAAERILGENAEEALERLAEPPPVLRPAPDGWRLARSAEATFVADVKARFGIPVPLGDSVSHIQTLANLAKEREQVENTGAIAPRSAL